MSTRTDPPKPMFGHDPGTSPGAQAPRPLAISPPPEAAQGLPAAYGVPALELLVVDPANLFVSWEVTADQLDAAQVSLAAGFSSRRLVIEVRAIEEPSILLSRSELFGDVGRWFLSVPPVGCMVSASLFFEADDTRYDLLTAGPVALPRVTPIEPDVFEELHVSYGAGAGGRLTLAGLRRAASAEPPAFGQDSELVASIASALDVSGGSSPATWSGQWPPGNSSIPGVQDD